MNKTAFRMKQYLWITLPTSTVLLMPFIGIEFAIPLLFVIWYAGIIIEHTTKLEKTAPALMAGFTMWAKLNLNGSLPDHAAEDRMGEIAPILIFLMCAMTIVEIVIMQNGFAVLKNNLAKIGGSIKKFYWVVISLVSVLTMVIDNMTTTILMGSLAMSVVSDSHNRKWFLSSIVIVANIMGAPSVLGDVTTTMLWLQDLIGEWMTTAFLFVPCFLASMLGAYVISRKLTHEDLQNRMHEKGDSLILLVGVASFLLVPIIKALTHMPPWQIIPFSLAITWIASELRHPEQNFSTMGKNGKNIFHAFSNIEISAVLFFFGILFAVAAMGQSGHILATTSRLIATAEKVTPRGYAFDAVNYIIGWFSAVVDNVPMVQAGIEGFKYAPHSYEWYALAYSCGTGGNITILGTAAGVVSMAIAAKYNIADYTFSWWIRKIGPVAVLTYTFGYVLMVFLKEVFF